MELVLVLKKGVKDSENYPFSIYFSAEDTGRITIEMSVNGNKTRLLGKADFLTRTWHHVALVRDIAGTNACLYINGKKEAIGTVLTGAENNSAIFIGGDSYENEVIGVYDCVGWAAIYPYGSSGRNDYGI